jgi:hypothetical protein
MRAHRVVLDTPHAERQHDVISAFAVVGIAVEDADASHITTLQQDHGGGHQAVEGEKALGKVVTGMVKAADGRTHVFVVIQSMASGCQQRFPGVGQGGCHRRILVVKAVGNTQVEHTVHKVAVMGSPYQHNGFSVDAGVCIEAHDCAALERLLRYCARLLFAFERLRKEGAELVYRCAKQRSEPSSDKRGARADELHLTPLELIARIAALVPPPRTHQHRYFGVLAPNSPHKAAAVALAAPAKQVVVQTEPAITGEGVPGVVPLGHAISPMPEPGSPKRAPAHYL